MSEKCSHNCSSCGGNPATCGQTPPVPEWQNRIKNKVMVLSGKGGVGKSTVAASLAVRLAAKEYKVGLLDVDFHGPSQPTLFQVSHMRMEQGVNGLIPLKSQGVKLVSLGVLMENPDSAVIWRGPAKMGVLEQLLNQTDWGDLDFLILDFPPGTGDESLSAAQLLQGEKKAIVVTTPQELSLADCRKCLDFCRQLDLKISGIVENMSGFVCPHCNQRSDIFSSGGGEHLAQKYSVPLLATLPLDPEFMNYCDHGEIGEGLIQRDIVRKEIDKIIDGLIK